MNIVFGQKRLVNVATRNAAVEKYPERAVITVEGLKGAKKSRKILINNTASELLSLAIGEVENIVFAPVEETKQILIANTATISGETDEMVSYSTSKNKVSFGDTSEKGKGITSSHMCKEIFKFLERDEDSNLEFELVVFPSEGIDAFSLEEFSAENVIETNNETMTAEQVIDSVQQQVADAEEIDPVMEQEVIAEEVIAEEPSVGGLQRREAVTAEWVD